MIGSQGFAGLIGEGRYREALAVLEREASREPAIAAIQADLLLQVGRASESVAIARRTLRTTRLPDVVAGHCHMVLGSCFRNSGALSAACEHFQKSIVLADRANNREQACWSHLRLMATIAEAYGGDSAFAIVPAVRRRVAQLGSPHATCALHAFVAEIETGSSAEPVGNLRFR